LDASGVLQILVLRALTIAGVRALIGRPDIFLPVILRVSVHRLMTLKTVHLFIPNFGNTLKISFCLFPKKGSRIFSERSGVLFPIFVLLDGFL
jgi:hypothetical protein